MRFGDRLRVAREYAGLTQEELGIKAGCGQGVVSKIERGDQDSSGYIVKLAKACNVNPEWLDDEVGEMKITGTTEENMLVYKIKAHSPEDQALKAMQSMDERTKYQYVKIGDTLTQPNGDRPGTEGPTANTQ